MTSVGICLLWLLKLNIPWTSFREPFLIAAVIAGAIYAATDRLPKVVSILFGYLMGIAIGVSVVDYLTSIHGPNWTPIALTWIGVF